MKLIQNAIRNILKPAINKHTETAHGRGQWTGGYQREAGSGR